MSTTTQPVKLCMSRNLRGRSLLRFLLGREGALNGSTWVPVVFVIGAIAAVAFADDLVESISLGYLCVLPLVLSAISVRKEVSWGLIAICILLHDYYYPAKFNPIQRMFHNLTATLSFVVVVFVIRRYVNPGEALTRALRRQRDDLVRDLELAAQVKRLFLPSDKPAIAGQYLRSHQYGVDRFCDYAVSAFCQAEGLCSPLLPAFWRPEIRAFGSGLSIA